MPPPEARLYVDGGARGNPGPAGFGVVVEGPGGEPRASYFGYLGVATNNVAEYRGLLAALEHARHRGWRRLWIGSDSELMVRQIRGEYRVKNAGLKPLFERCRRLLAGFEHFTIEHLPRERNAEADRLANQAMNLRSSDLPPGASPETPQGDAGVRGDAGRRVAYNAPASAQGRLFTAASHPGPAAARSVEPAPAGSEVARREGKGVRARAGGAAAAGRRSVRRGRRGERRGTGRR